MITKGQVAQFERRLAHMINEIGIDNACNTPDYILSRFLIRQLRLLAELESDKEKHRKLQVVNFDEMEQNR